MKKNSKLIKSSVGLFGVLVLILTGYATQAQKPNPAHNSILPANEEKLRVLFSSNPVKLLECLSPIKTWGDKLPENTTLLVGLDQSGNRYCQIVHKDDTGKYLNECRRALAQNSQCMTVMTNQAVYYDRLDALFSLLSSSSDTRTLEYTKNRMTNDTSTLDAAKAKCAELGYRLKTEAYGRCVLEFSK